MISSRLLPFLTSLFPSSIFSPSNFYLLIPLLVQQSKIPRPPHSIHKLLYCKSVPPWRRRVAPSNPCPSTRVSQEELLPDFQTLCMLLPEDPLQRQKLLAGCIEPVFSPLEEFIVNDSTAFGLEGFLMSVSSVSS